MTQKNNSVLPRNYLFVCTGNTCRSPFAQVVFNQVAKRRGIKRSSILRVGCLSGAASL